MSCCVKYSKERERDGERERCMIKVTEFLAKRCLDEFEDREGEDEGHKERNLNLAVQKQWPSVLLLSGRGCSSCPCVLLFRGYNFRLGCIQLLLYGDGRAMLISTVQCLLELAEREA